MILASRTCFQLYMFYMFIFIIIYKIVTFVPSPGAFVHLRFCGDFNSQGLSAVNELLTTAIVNPDFRESGDPTEKGQEGQDFEGWI